MRYGKKHAKYQRNINAVDFIYSAHTAKTVWRKKFVTEPARERQREKSFVKRVEFLKYVCFVSFRFYFPFIFPVHLDLGGWCFGWFSLQCSHQYHDAEVTENTR